MVEASLEMSFILRVMIQKQKDAVYKSALSDLKFSHVVEMSKINIQTQSEPILATFERFTEY